MKKHCTGYLLIFLLTLIACELPNQIVQNLSPDAGKPLSTISPLPAAGTATETLVLDSGIDSSPYPEQVASTAIAEPYPSTEQELTPADQTYPLPDETLTATISAQAKAKPSPQPTIDAYPADALMAETVEPLVQSMDPAYPGADASQIPVDSLQTYPGLETSSASLSPNSATQLSPYPQPTFGSTTNPPALFPTAPPINTPGPPAVVTMWEWTATPTFTRTPFLTPTPTLTFTPTPTRTPLPAPPWLNVRIRASDPKTVVLAAGKPQLVEFFAYWSGPSLAMAPLIAGLEKEYSGRVGFIFLDIDNPATKPLQNILGFNREPHFFFVDGNGKVLSDWVGYASLEELRLQIEAVLP